MGSTTSPPAQEPILLPLDPQQLQSPPPLESPPPPPPPPQQQQQQQQQQQHIVQRHVVRTVTFPSNRHQPLSWILNVLWLLLVGWHMFVTWATLGLAFCLTLVGIPCGWQLFKIAGFLLCPFGKGLAPTQVVRTSHSLGQQQQSYNECCCGCACHCCGCRLNCRDLCTFILNILWGITIGWALALQALLSGLLLMLTIIGIPFGWQCFKLAYFCLRPFGLSVTVLPQEIVMETTTTTVTTAAIVPQQDTLNCDEENASFVSHALAEPLLAQPSEL